MAKPKVRQMTAREVLEVVSTWEQQYAPTTTGPVEDARESDAERLEIGYNLMKDYISNLHPGTKTL